MDFKKLNQSKGLNISTNILCAFILLFTIASFAQYYSMKLKMNNPLIPEYLIEMATTPYLKKGIILTLGLIAIFVSKFYKKNLLALSISILLIVYFIFSNHYIGGWNTQIK